MTKFRRAARIDSNQGMIVKALREIPGITVATRHDDILVGWLWRTYWYEIKASDKASIRPAQITLRDQWTGHYRVVSSVEEILQDIGLTAWSDKKD